jgi:hypothetical protein
MRSKEKAAVVPSQAVQGGGLYVVRDGRLTRAEGVELGVSGVERVEVTAGLRPGDRVVVSPVADLKPGQWVRDTYMDPDTAAGLNKPKEKEIFRGGF